MPAAPGASRPTRIQPKPSGSAPARPKMAGPRPQHKSSSAVKKPVGKASPQPQRSHQRSSPRAHAKATAGRILLSTPHHHRSAQKPQHVHRHMTSGKHGASSKPVYVVCNRKHYDDGIYARCQRVLRRFVKWNR